MAESRPKENNYFFRWILCWIRRCFQDIGRHLRRHTVTQWTSLPPTPKLLLEAKCADFLFWFLNAVWLTEEISKPLVRVLFGTLKMEVEYTVRHTHTHGGIQNAGAPVRVGGLFQMCILQVGFWDSDFFCFFCCCFSSTT